ncbi:sugar phosphate isomerase/epimerase family protein [Novosphingobium profundi]|uniref:sugar phosphate isomerase/epimerase family protein n=1 Tax=Novosphingobium profundi TaxID=1774954 RepID=UPI001CFCAE5A|nr:sugar phosphate isomerase/epimerase [Novosphingobium profundi]
MHRLHRRQMLAAMAIGAAALAIPGRLLAKEPADMRHFLSDHGLPLGVQLYTVDAMAREDIRGTLRKLSAIGFRSLELAGLHGHTPQDLRAAADEAGLAITSIHLGDALIGRTEADTEKLVEDLGVLGVRDVVLPMFVFPRDVTRGEDEPFIDYLYRAVHSQGADVWERTADLLNERAASLARHGIKLAYHNHNVEFGPVDDTGRTGWEILMERTDPELVGLEVDLGWVAAAGIDPVEFVTRYAGRVRQAHVKDIHATTKSNFAFRQDPAEVGAGSLDWGRLLPAAYAAGVRQFYVEQEPPFTADRFTSLAKSAAYLGAAPAVQPS